MCMLCACVCACTACVHVDMLDLTLQPSTSTTTENITILNCVAMGFPNAQLLHWMTGTGDNISTDMFSTTSSTQDYEVTTSTTQSIDNLEKCRMSRGYVCTFTNIGLPNIIRRSIFHCSPGNHSSVLISRY